jgi:pyridoxal phosphate enzyme (YggS family)
MTEKSLSSTRFETAYPEILSNIRKAQEESPFGNKARLLAATKTVPVEVINEAISMGLDLIGENKVQELKEKYPYLDKSAEIHFIGHLQTNKVKDVVPMVSMIHSVSSEKLAGEISKQCQKIGKNMDVLLEVNIGNEEAKSGFSPEEVIAACQKISKLPSLSVKGLMAIPPICENEEENSKYFCKMRQLFIDIEAEKMDNVNMVYLSMGMSGDYREAVRCGANIVRIGSLLFGERNYNK